MKRAGMLIAVLAMASLAVAQNGSEPQNNKPAGQPTASPQAGSAQQGAAQAAPAEGKRPPQAKTQPEFEAYKAAVANQNDPAAMEKAANDFATKFPDSELRAMLFKAAMHGYQSANNADKMMEMGRAVLKIDPDDPEALVGVAEVLTERTRDTDLDKDQRLAEAAKLAQHAVETVDTDVVVPAGTPQDRIDAYKSFYRSTAYSILGALSFNQEKYPEAENYFQKSIDAYPSQPDPVVVLRLALALDKQSKYPEALKQANRAVELTQENTTAGTLARQERNRLVQLTGGTTPAPAKPPAGTPNPAPKN
jgi:tetratricopeptide (TPR) repeat protein